MSGHAWRKHIAMQNGADDNIKRQMQPTVTDDDKNEITVSLNGRELRGWSYSTDGERRQKMVQAREYIEGWCDGRDAK